MNKNKELLESFAKYCAEHPEQRFWQSLRNWSGIKAIYAQNYAGLFDTFYWDLKNQPESKNELP